MNQLFVTLLLLAGLAGLAGPVRAAGEKELPAVGLFASFGERGDATQQGAALTRIAYAERSGDAVIDDLRVHQGRAELKGRLGLQQGSRWAGVGVMLSFGSQPGGIDLSGFRAIRIELAAPTVNKLRIRIASNDSKTLQQGCYPVKQQPVKAELASYTIALADFKPEAFCGANGRDIQATLAQLQYVEIADSDADSPHAAEFSVGRIEFVR